MNVETCIILTAEFTVSSIMCFELSGKSVWFKIVTWVEKANELLEGSNFHVSHNLTEQQKVQQHHNRFRVCKEAPCVSFGNIREN